MWWIKLTHHLGGDGFCQWLLMTGCLLKRYKTGNKKNPSKFSIYWGILEENLKKWLNRLCPSKRPDRENRAWERVYWEWAQSWGVSQYVSSPKSTSVGYWDGHIHCPIGFHSSSVKRTIPGCSYCKMLLHHTEVEALSAGNFPELRTFLPATLCRCPSTYC